MNDSNTNVELHYVLCSTCFDDVVVISPPNIDHCDLKDNYQIPQRNQIRNMYFKVTRKAQTNRLSQKS